MKVLLRVDVPQVGKTGEVREVKNGFARNYLFPQKFAVPATEAALLARKNEETRVRLSENTARKKEKELAGKLQKIILTIEAKATQEGKLFGGIHREQIVQGLSTQGIMIEQQSIVLLEPLKTIGSHQVEIHLKFGLKSHIQVCVTPESVIPAHAGIQK